MVSGESILFGSIDMLFENKVCLLVEHNDLFWRGCEAAWTGMYAEEICAICSFRLRTIGFGIHIFPEIL